jgi:hypothetical protein
MVSVCLLEFSMVCCIVVRGEGSGVVTAAKQLCGRSDVRQRGFLSGLQADY